MARKRWQNGRLNIQYIMDNRKRMETLQRRLPTVRKKARELAVLCGVPACLVVYCPGKAQPVVWPSPGAAANVVRLYRDQMGSERSKNELDETKFLKEMVEKMKVELAKVQRQCRDEEIKLAMIDFLAGRRKSFDDLPAEFVASIGLMVQNKLQTINARLQELCSGVAPALHPPPPPASFTHP
ncbi:unnamed protein product [Alopecurus aequalis]